MKRVLAALLAVMMLAAVFAGCSSSETETPAAPDGTEGEQPADGSTARDSIVIAVSSDILSMDPYRYNETPTNQFMLHIYETLITNDHDGNIIPCLAESWETSEDGLTWTFHLRQGVKFHDGSDFTAEDVLASIEVARDTASPSVFANNCASIAEITAPNDYTVVITTSTVNPVLLSDLAPVYILKKENVEGKTEQEIASVVCGTGRYKFVEQVAEDHIDIVANEDYWGEVPEIKNVRFRPISNEATRTATMLSGEVDLCVDIAVRDVERLQNTEGINVVTQPGLRAIYLNIDGRDESPAVEGQNPMADPKVRQAMYHAIDIDTIIQNVMNGMATPMVSYIPETYIGGDPSAERLQYDPELAQQLLTEAGYPDGFTVTLDAPNDRYVNDADVAQAVAGYLERVGITVNLNLMPKANFFTYIKPAQNQTGFLMTGWSDSSGDGTTLARDLLHSYTDEATMGAVNRGHYSNPEVDALVEEAMQTIDEEQRAELVRQADAIAREEVAYIPLHWEHDIYAMKDDIDYTPRQSKYVMAWEISFK